MTTHDERARAAIATAPEQPPVDPGAVAAQRNPRVGIGITTLVPLLIVAAFPLVLLSRRLNGLRDPDSFWHILGGQHFASTREVVFADPFGHFSQNEWVQLDWLSDLAMAGAYAVGGLPGVGWLYTTAMLGFFVALLYLARQRAGLIAATLAAVAAMIGSSGSLSERSQVFSFIFIAVTLAAWHRTWQDGRSRWWLVPMTWLWACLHGYWFVGPLVGGVVILGMLLDRRTDLRGALRSAAVPLASGVAACLTPLGPKIITAPLTVNSYAQYVSEYRPPDIHHPAVAATVGLLVVAALGWALSTQRPTRTDVLLWLLALAWTLLYARTVALGAILAAPLAAQALQLAIRKEPEPRTRLETRVTWGAMVAASLVAAVLGPLVAPGVAGKPTGLDGALRALPAETVVLNDDGLGGWLLLTYPDLRPVADTRTYLFSHEYIEDYITARSARPGWQDFVTETGARVALVPEDEALAAALQDQLGWTAQGTDGKYVLLQAP